MPWPWRAGNVVRMGKPASALAAAYGPGPGVTVPQGMRGRRANTDPGLRDQLTQLMDAREAAGRGVIFPVAPGAPEDSLTRYLAEQDRRKSALAMALGRR